MTDNRTPSQEALAKGLYLCCATLAFIGRDQGTKRLDSTLDGLCNLAKEYEPIFRAALAERQTTPGAGVTTTQRQQSPVVADYGEHFLVIHANREGTTIGIDHPCDAVWSDVLAAHIAVRDRINERIAAQDGCPFKPTPPEESSQVAGERGLCVEFSARRKALGLSLREVARLTDVSFATLARFERGEGVGARSLARITSWVANAAEMAGNMIWRPIEQLADIYEQPLWIASPRLVHGDSNPEGIAPAYWQDGDGPDQGEWRTISFDMCEDAWDTIGLAREDVTHFLIPFGPYAVALSKPQPTEGVELLVAARDAYEAFVKARTAMNAARPAIDATPAERALYDERYRVDHEAEREHFSTAVRLARQAGSILAALSTQSPAPADSTAGDEARAGWQPIETAPKDGSAVDLWGSELGRMTNCYWGRPSHDCGEMGQYCDSDWHGDQRETWVDGTFEERLSDTFLTHWMPIPGAPLASLGNPSEGVK